MSKIFGYVLLGGIVGSILLSLVLVLVTWVRSANPPQEPIKVTPAPTTKAAIQGPESLGFRLVDARLSLES